MPTYNHTSGIWRFNFDGGKSLMITGDAQQMLKEELNLPEGYELYDNQIADAFGGHLKSDMLQIIHHGSNGGSLKFYGAVDPNICFWPQLDINFYHDQRHLGIYNATYTNGVVTGGSWYFNYWIRNTKTTYEGQSVDRVHYTTSATHTVYIPTVTYHYGEQTKTYAELYCDTDAQQGTSPTITLKTPDFTWEDCYNLSGWATSVNGEVNYQTNQTDIASKDNIELYAVGAAQHNDGDKDHDCDECGTAMGTHEAAEGKHTCDYCGETVTKCSDGDDKNHNCDICGAPDISEHEYDDGVVTKKPTLDEAGEKKFTCSICGGTYTETVDKLKPIVDKFLAQVIMGNNLDMMFAFPKNALDNWEGYYVEIVRQYTGIDKDNDVVTIPFGNWDTNEDYYVVTYEGLAAKEMTDIITVTIYNADHIAVCRSWEDSIRAYSMRGLEDATSVEEKALFVDMLNYGAAAQVHFNYNATDLANNQLTDEQKTWTGEEKVFAESLDRGDKWVGSNLILESNVRLLVAFSGLTRDMSAKIEFTDHYGKSVSVDVKGSEFGVSGRYFYINIDELVIADAREVITITVYNADKTVYTTCEESIEDYLARGDSMNDLYAKIMRFADSAHAYLHREDQ